MGFRNIREYALCESEGRCLVSHFRKTAGGNTAYWWIDLSMGAGTPVANYYASSPLIAKTFDGWKGLFHGDDKAPAEMYLAGWMIAQNSATMLGHYVLCDYLLSYPFVDLSADSEQIMDNTVTLPRYTDGAGVMAIIVGQTPVDGSGQFTFDYINQDGVQRTSPLNKCNTTAGGQIGNLVNCQPGSGGAIGPYLTLLDGDTGIRRIISISMLAPNGGLGAIVLVKPLADIIAAETATISERSYVDGAVAPPRIYDGAFLSLIACAYGSTSGQVLTGSLKFIWI